MIKKIFIIIIGIIYSTILLIFGYISGHVFIGLIGLFIFIPIILFDIDKLKEIDLKSLRFVLRDLKVESKEIQELAINLCELIAMNSEFQGRWGTEEWNDLRRRIEKHHIEKVLSTIGNTSLKEKVFKYQALFEKIDSLKNEGKNSLEENEGYNNEISKFLAEQLAILEK